MVQDTPVEVWGQTSSDETVHRILLQNGDLSAWVITYGAVLQDLRLSGHKAPLVLGLNNLGDYENQAAYLGATIGRCANRIGNSRFELDGKTYALDKNENIINHLHGGRSGFSQRVWQIESVEDDVLVLSLDSPDGDMGYPGNLRALCTYRLEADNALSIDLQATSDQATICNLTNHSYFNLADGGATDVNTHQVMIDAEHVVETDDQDIATGHLTHVEGTTFDFRSARAISDFQFHDINYCLADERRDLTPVAQIISPDGQLCMEVETTETGVQFYASKYLEPGLMGLDGIEYGFGSGICLETQVWPGAINHQNFPSAVLRPGETQIQRSRYRFVRQKARYPA